MMRWLTCNVWHGLNGKGVFRFGELEPPERRLLRRQRLISGLKPLQAQLVFLQEVNPVDLLAPQWAALLDMREIHCSDNSGVKWKTIGIPINLQSGLAILYSSELQLRRWNCYRLSGDDWSLQNNHNFSLQIKEARWALVAEFELASGQRFVAVNTHLHHGFELNTKFRSELENAVKRLSLDTETETQFWLKLQAGEKRRDEEVQRLLSIIEEWGGQDLPCLLGGDFNATPESVVVTDLTSHGFSDLWTELHPQSKGFTWDRTRNSGNHKFMDKFAAGLHWNEPWAPKIQSLVSQIEAEEQSPRRIDYLMLKKGDSQWRAKNIRLALDRDEYGDGVLPSDHFALLAELDVITQ